MENAVIIRSCTKRVHNYRKYTMNTEKFEAARINLSTFVLSHAITLSMFHGVDYFPVDNAPNDYDALYDMWRHCQSDNGPFLVWSGGSDKTIYTTQAANHAFRFWHDILHVTKGLKFDTMDEIEIGIIQTKAIQAEFGKDSLEAKIMLADTVGQSVYAQMNQGEFPDNQVSFVYSLIQAQK